MSLTRESLIEHFERQPLFEDKSWLLSPEPWPISREEHRTLTIIGRAVHEFYRAQERLYRWSGEDRNLLRNGELRAPWVAEYLDRGKPEGLVTHGQHDRYGKSVPLILRPDLLQTASGYMLTEMDAVPGGVGLTAYLNAIYAKHFEGVVGGDGAMLDRFYASIKRARPDLSHPLVAIVVSDEAATYRPEFRWLAAELRKRGHPVYCYHPDDLMPMGETLCGPVDGNPEKIDIIYRFFELFDLRNIGSVDAILEAVESAECAVTPPMRAFQEEKLSLALFHHHRLEAYWRESLSREAYRTLSRIIPKTWIMDPVDLPPNAVLDAPPVGGRPIARWEELASASQKEREWVIKVSGFHELAWGARSVVYGRDVSREEWEESIDEALEMAAANLHILQEYHKPRRLSHPVYTEEGEVRTMEGRLRLCPYYYVMDQQVELCGGLATFCPADKKIIHGMSDAILLPLYIQDGR